MSFDKLLIANRGEIACRVIRTARALGLRTVAVYSDADAGAPHVRLADEAVRLGPGPAADSYLRIDAVIDAARRTGAQAVHPGYGFLSERADFAQACADAGLVFVGPPAAAIVAMGDKAGAKRRMREAGVPCAPGYLGERQDDETLAREATAMGYPLLVKAVAGGGGRGMRLVHRAEDLAEGLAGARREATSAFGDGTLMLERLVVDGRHIEIQVFCDAHGNAVHLGERDCTSQRRRQKVIEESPSPIVSPAMREAMGRDAVAAAQAVGYVGAGTIEFIVDAAGAHYFLEMNTRLQVEHPVTECVTGLDLVEWQLRVAAGERLPLAQHEIRFTGHAIEARLYAEDPYDGFRPQTGRVTHWRPGRAVAAGRGSVRIDDGLAEGQAISPFYDAMVAKVIVHGRDRDDARLRLRRALEDAPLLGLVNNGRYLCDLLQAPDFAAGTMTTTRLDEWAAAVTGPSAKPAPHDDDWRIAAAVLGLGDTVKGIDGPRAGGVASRDLVLDDGTRRRTLRVRAVTTSSASAGTAIASAVETTDADVTLDGRAARLRLHAVDADGLRAVEIDGLRRRVLVRVEAGTSDVIDAAIVVRDGAVHRFAEPSPYPSTDVAADASRVLAPVAGTVAQVRVRAGDRVAAGDPLVCVEAMKMEMWLPAAAGGVVVAVHAVERASVAARALLVELLPD
jgi:geranyl-CoA carboxylase alpha subunit